MTRYFVPFDGSIQLYLDPIPLLFCDLGDASTKFWWPHTQQRKPRSSPRAPIMPKLAYEVKASDFHRTGKNGEFLIHKMKSGYIRKVISFEDHEYLKSYVALGLLYCTKIEKI